MPERAICMTVTCPAASRCRLSAVHVPAEATVKGLPMIHPHAHRPGEPCEHYEPFLWLDPEWDAAEAMVDETEEEVCGVAGGQGRSLQSVAGCGERLGWLLAAATVIIALALAWGYFVGVLP